MKKIRFITWIILMVGSLTRISQAQETTNITGEFRDLSFSRFTEVLEEKYNLRFFYSEGITDSVKVNAYLSEVPLERAMSQVLSKEGLKFFIYKDLNVFVFRGVAPRIQVPERFMATEREVAEEKELTESEELYITGRKTLPPERKIFGTESQRSSRESAILSGRIVNSETGEPVVGTTLYIEALQSGTVTDINGYYSLPIKPGRHLLRVSSIGMENITYDVEIWEDGRLNIDLTPEMISINEVVIRAEKYHNVQGTQMGMQHLDIREINEIPKLMGETDVLAVVKMVPGVQSVGEGSSGFNVRGSPSDQNLFYINKIPVYNTAHLFGFFSAFNADIVKSFTLYKSHIPAKYGGRLASIFDINAKEGNRRKFTMRGGISPVTGRLAIETPLKKEKGSFILGGRTTYSDWILRQIDDVEIRSSSAGFYDLTGNFSYDPNKNNKLQLFGFMSRDRFSFASDLHYQYANTGASMNWQHIISDRFFSSHSAVASQYTNEQSEDAVPLEAWKKRYRISHYELKTDYDYTHPSGNDLNFGLSGILYDLDRGDIQPMGEESSRTPEYFGEETGVEAAVYFSDEWKALTFLTLHAGLRYSLFANIGPGTVRNYEPDGALTDERATGTTDFGTGKVIQHYSGPEWRLAANFLLGKRSSVKLSLNRHRQYLFMLSNTIAISPTDQWKLSDRHISPQVGDQISLGYYFNSVNNIYEFSIEGYQKKINNVVEYRDGANLIGSRWVETEVVQGNQEAYGAEFMIRKKRGMLNGWLSYAYSKSLVTVKGQYEGESINRGKPFPANYDKPHAFNLVGNYRLGRQFSFSVNVVYNTGRPVTYPSALYYMGGRQILDYTDRNKYRLPDYFRVDASINMEGSLLKGKFAHGSWSLGVYNLTGRRNVYSVFFKNVEGEIKGYQKSIFGVPIVTLTYNFKLGDYSDE